MRWEGGGEGVGMLGCCIYLCAMGGGDGSLRWESAIEKARMMYINGRSVEGSLPECCLPTSNLGPVELAECAFGQCVPQ